MSTGPNEDATDWVKASANPGHNKDQLEKPLDLSAYEAALTATVEFSYTPTTGSQYLAASFFTAGYASEVLTVTLTYSGTGDGSVVAAGVYYADTYPAVIPIVLVAGTIARFKVTCDAAAINLYFNDVLIQTIALLTPLPLATIALANLSLNWDTGVGETLYAHAWTVQAGVH